MTTRISRDVALAASVLSNDGIIGMPTETVYGLAALALNEIAVARVFSTKGRPTNHPLIVHLSPRDNIERWGVLNEIAQTIAKAVWPGPITLLVPRTRLVPDWVTGGRDTVALRIPSHPMAIDLLDMVGDALVAPSANRFGQVSPTRAEHVLQDLGDDVDLILDGGPCEVGVESTIVECISESLQILRPGKITAMQLAEITGLPLTNDEGPSRAPGMMISHYAPHARVELCTSLDEATERGIAYESKKISYSIIHHDDLTKYALSVYDELRTADLEAVQVVLAVMPAAEGIGLAIRDRLTKAAAH
jgi:L-threonylcarbamoyladenylate synthase